MMQSDRLYPEARQILKAFYALGPSTNAEIAKHLQRKPDAILKAVIRYRADGLLNKVSDPKHRVSVHVLTLKGVKKLAKKRRIRRPSSPTRSLSPMMLLSTPNSIFSMASCMGLSHQTTYKIKA